MVLMRPKEKEYRWASIVRVQERLAPGPPVQMGNNKLSVKTHNVRVFWWYSSDLSRGTSPPTVTGDGRGFKCAHHSQGCGLRSKVNVIRYFYVTLPLANWLFQCKTQGRMSYVFWKIFACIVWCFWELLNSFFKYWCRTEISEKWFFNLSRCQHKKYLASVLPEWSRLAIWKINL